MLNMFLERLPTVIVLSVVFLSSCASPVTTTESDEAVVYGNLETGIVNSSEVSEPVQAFVREKGLQSIFKRRPLNTLSLLEESLSANPSNTDLRRSLCELAIKEARRRENTAADRAVGLYLTAAEYASGTQDETFRALGSDSTARAVELLHRVNHDWDKEVSMPGAYGMYRLVYDQSPNGAVDPAAFRSMIAADQLDLSGFRKRTRIVGEGAPLIGAILTENRWPVDANHPSKGELDLPLNALLDFRDGGEVSLTIYDLTLNDDAKNTTRMLAADYTAPLAKMMSDAPNPISGILGTFRPDRYESLEGLHYLEPYRAEKIPVILVHGLLGEPLTWRDTCNELIADSMIRENFQFWLYRYPTSAPILDNAAALRKLLRRAHAHYAPLDKNSEMDQMVIIGYSLGGLLTSLQVRSSGNTIWDLFSKKPLDAIILPPADRQRLQERLYFEPSPFIKRTLFIATPHRGSPLARKTLGRLLSSFVKIPTDVLDIGARIVARNATNALTETGEAWARSELNGVSELDEGTSNLETYVDLPLSRAAMVHSIIGDRGNGDTPESSDGWVPYHSSHLDNAASEKIVAVDHRAHHHPDTIFEINRILRLHLRGVRNSD